MMNTARRVTSLALAILFAVSSVLVCAPTVFASALERHCRPTQAVEPDCGHAQESAMDCCATSAPRTPLRPESGPLTARNPGAAPAAAPADTAAVIAAVELPALTRLLHRSPLHGFRSTDLPTLHVVFLI